MQDHELEKSKIFIIVEIIEYIVNLVVIKTILKKTTDNVSAISVEPGEGFAEKTSPFDTFHSNNRRKGRYYHRFQLSSS